MKIYVLHENENWVLPLREALTKRGLPFAEWFLAEGLFDLSSAPPQGVFYNRMSASSHTRGHRFAAEYTAAVLAWLEGHGRRVVNGSRALGLEVSKAAQYAALARHGIRVPRTVVAGGRERIAEAAESLGQWPLILKPNRGGKGLGVRLFQSARELREYLESGAFEPPLDGSMLLQQYVRSPDASIVRAEFIGGAFFYAVRVDTGNGFELCPADACAVEDASGSIGESDAVAVPARPPFEILEDFHHPVLNAHRRFLAENGVEIAGIEFIADDAGEVYTYDVNTNTNYNPDAEARAGKSGMGGIADFLGAELNRLQESPSRERAIA